VSPLSIQPRRVAVIGGGIAGLAALRELRQAREAGCSVREWLIEARDRLGGVIRTERLEGFTIEAGPDSFLTEKPEAADLCREIGLGDELIGSNDAARSTGILHRGRLETLPDGLFFFVPTKTWPVIATSLLPPTAKLHLARELFMAPAADWVDDEQDESVAQFIRRHFGQSMLESVVDPLLSGVYGGDAELLSVRSVLPRFCAMERERGSLIRAILNARSRAPRSTPVRPIFTTLRCGLGEMVARLTPPVQTGEPPSETCVCFQTPVAGIETNGSPGAAKNDAAPRYLLRFDDGRTLACDAIILATPASECGRLLMPLDRELGAALDGIVYSSALTVALAFDESVSAQIPKGFGFLVPKKEGRAMLACTFVHQKFEDRAPAGKALLRCFLGGAGNARLLGMEDREILAIVRKELREILGVKAGPMFHRVYRWPRAMAQYNVGHHKRLATIHRRLASLPGIFLAGNAYSGIGISDCIRTGKTAARAALDLLAKQRTETVVA
jgi:protoporphyrinogen/coproporphyrinogen III oxidase